MSLEDGWSNILKQIKNNYPRRKIKEKEDRVEVRFNPSTLLIIEKGGFVEGSMPLHHFQVENAEEVTVENNITIVRGDNFEYMFKK
ncbi:MAG: hypothetical protein ABEK04_03820 [Candidatus Nanohalobium sp.]